MDGRKLLFTGLPTRNTCQGRERESDCLWDGPGGLSRRCRPLIERFCGL